MPSAPLRDSLDAARALLRRAFGYPDFRRPQVPAVHAVLAGRDALVVLPTGGGKSLCFQVPALLRGGLTVVVSPLISLMQDQVEALERRGLPAAFLNSTIGASAASERLARAERGELRLLYLAPERLGVPATLARLRAIGVAMLAVDEAHCISEWGHDFRPSYRRLGRCRHELGDPQTVALTATATPDVRADIVRQLRLREPAVVVGGFDRTNLALRVEPAATRRAKAQRTREALDAHPGPAIVYAPTRRVVEQVAADLERTRVPAIAYHAGLDGSHRAKAQDAFMQERVRVIVATSAFGMGIDKPDVRLVVHHAMPGSLEAYYQEAGRAGRDGDRSTCILLHGRADRRTHEHFLAAMHPGRRTVEQVFRTLRDAADANGLALLPEGALTAGLRGRLAKRHAPAAVRILARHGLLAPEPPSGGRVVVRLLATPERITAELTGERAFEREVLRAIWRAVGSRFETGAMVDLDGLPPGLGGAAALRPVLERLEATQFVTVAPVGGGYRLSEEARVANRPPIDWDALERRRRSDHERLAAMERYAVTAGCRRAFILDYFGDPDAAARCGDCDRCVAD